MSRTLITIVTLSILLAVTSFSLSHHATAQYDASYCQGKKDEMTSRANEWLREWSTANSDPNGRIRTDGKQLASEIGLTLVNCETSLSDHDKLPLTQMTVVINNSIDKDINYGPPCDPNCARGPPIT